jgi:hypothetical protein
MYSATLEPLLQQCNEAIEMAKQGAIDEARVCLDRIRFLRSLLAQSNVSNDSQSGATEANFPSGAADLLGHHISIATAVNQRLETIHQWIKESRAAFSVEELRQSNAGINLFIDDALPDIWDFKQDLVLLTDLDGYEIREVLRARGQAKFIWMTEHVISDGRGDDSRDLDTLYVAAGQDPEKTELERFLRRFSVPRAALITTSVGPRDEQNFNAVARAIGAAVIAGSTTQWLPQATAEQWIGSTPTLANCASAIELRHEFEDADVLVVSPGPSLKHDLELLAKVQDRFLIFASVKALSALFDAGIKPDLAIWQDPRDHSHAIPDRPEISEVGLVLSEGCHPAFYQANFAAHFPYPDPGFVGTELSTALHGPSVPKLGGTSVSTLSAVLALEFNARSVTLLGQDLSIGEGLYVSGGAPTEEGASSHGDHLSCIGINGELLPTLPNYYAFISEFQNIALHFKDRVPLYNATSSGAYLEGWTHTPLEFHPVVTSNESGQPKNDIAAKYCNARPKIRKVTESLGLVSNRLEHAAKICDEIKLECLDKVSSGSNDCTVIDLLEQRLKLIFDEECPLLKYYTSRQSMALNAATESVQNLEENLRVSADYYESVARASRRLLMLCRDATEELDASPKLSSE